MMKPANEIFADIVESAGIRYAFGMPGGVTPFIFDALRDKPGIKCILSRQEGAASCMADMIARLTGKPALVIGQGLWIGTNAGFGIVESFLAGTPMVIITETSDYANLAQHAPYQCCTGEYGSVDLPSIMRSMTKFTTVATNPAEFIHGTQLAIKHAVTGRPGPAAVVSRWHAAVEKVDPEKTLPRLRAIEGHLAVSPPCISPSDAGAAAELLLAAEKPVIIVGHGAKLAGIFEETRLLAELIGAPVATSYMGKGVIAETHDLAVGVTGRLGQAAANEAVSGADVIFAVGSGLAPENTMMLASDYIKPEKQKIVQIDIEPRNIGFTFPVTLGINSDAKIAMSAILSALRAVGPRTDAADRAAAVVEMKTKKKYFTSAACASDARPIAPERVVAELNDATGPDDIIVADAGNNRMFLTKLFKTKRAGRFFAGGGAAGIGWGVPAAVAAQIHAPDKRVVCVCGDGGLLSTVSALETARQHKARVTYVVMNNASLGNVSDFIAPGRKELVDYDHTNFKGIAEAMDFLAIRVEDPAELGGALRRALESERPALVEVLTSRAPHFSLMM